MAPWGPLPAITPFCRSPSSNRLLLRSVVCVSESCLCVTEQLYTLISGSPGPTASPHTPRLGKGIILISSVVTVNVLQTCCLNSECVCTPYTPLLPFFSSDVHALRSPWCCNLVYAFRGCSWGDPNTCTPVNSFPHQTLCTSLPGRAGAGIPPRTLLVRETTPGFRSNRVSLITTHWLLKTVIYFR